MQKVSDINFRNSFINSICNATGTVYLVTVSQAKDLVNKSTNDTKKIGTLRYLPPGNIASTHAPYEGDR